MKTHLPRKQKTAVAPMERSRQLAWTPAALNFNVATDANASYVGARSSLLF